VAKSHSPGFLKIAEQARIRIQEISPHEINNRLQKKDQFYLIDVREDHEWLASFIPGAMHLSRGIIERDIEKTIPDLNAEIVLYCGGGYRSALAADSLQNMGYRNVKSMIGGFGNWIELGLGIKKGGHSNES
jgi:rhodanese-related sulfurtransferase